MSASHRKIEGLRLTLAALVRRRAITQLEADRYVGKSLGTPRSASAVNAMLEPEAPEWTI